MADASLAVTSAGIRLYIGDAMPETQDQAGYEAVSWSEIGEITDIPEFGKQYNLVTHNPLNNRKTFKRKGSYNNGQLSLTAARSPEDEGQLLVLEALDSDDAYPFKVEFNDSEEVGLPPTIQYFPGLVMSYTTNIGNVDSILQVSIQIEIDGEILEIPAETGS